VGELFLERAAVGEPGQLVVAREKVDARFVLALRGDVLADTAVADEDALFVAHLAVETRVDLPILRMNRIVVPADGEAV